MPFVTASEQAEAVGPAAEHLRAGGLIAYPTETVYGFGCALRARALESLAALKRRSTDKPFLVLVGAAAEAHGLEWTPEAVALASVFWPGPLTLALHAEAGSFPEQVLGRDGTVAVRASPHRGVQRLLAALGEPLTSTSANAPRGEPARSAQQVLDALQGVALTTPMLVLDGGTLPHSRPSTIVDASVRPPRLVRSGAISLEKLVEIVHGIEFGQA
jgi:L-threonylcarbamoyladenylate synthase